MNAAFPLFPLLLFSVLPVKLAAPLFMLLFLGAAPMMVMQPAPMMIDEAQLLEEVAPPIQPNEDAGEDQ